MMAKEKSDSVNVLTERLQAVHEDILEIKTIVKLNNGRISKLENYRSFLLGISALLTFFVSIGLIKIFGGN